MTKEEFLALMSRYYDEMGIGNDCVLEHSLDEQTQTLRVHVLSDAELESLAGHCADPLRRAWEKCATGTFCSPQCDECLWADCCEDAHGDISGCPDFTQREGDDW